MREVLIQRLANFLSQHRAAYPQDRLTEPLSDLDRKLAEEVLDTFGFDKMIGALSFYADPSHWRPLSSNYVPGFDPEPTAATQDRGDQARSVLDEVFQSIG